MKKEQKRPAKRFKKSENSESKRSMDFKQRMSEMRKKRIINMESGVIYNSLRDLCHIENVEYTRTSNSLADNKSHNNTPYRYFSILPYVNESTFQNNTGEEFKFLMFFKLVNQSDGYTKHSLVETKSGKRHVLDYEKTLQYINPNS